MSLLAVQGPIFKEQRQLNIGKQRLSMICSPSALDFLSIPPTSCSGDAMSAKRSMTPVHRNSGSCSTTPAEILRLCEHTLLVIATTSNDTDKRAKTLASQ